jgi:glycine dehydrogenase subunit 1
LLVVAVTEAMSFGLLESPGACGADIVIAEGQSFGVPLSFGGPYVGSLPRARNTRARFPDGSSAKAYDKQGRRGFVLTLATREQHIRREKGDVKHLHQRRLIALAATVYLETMGAAAFRKPRTSVCKKLLTPRDGSSR